MLKIETNQDFDCPDKLSKELELYGYSLVDIRGSSPWLSIIGLKFTPNSSSSSSSKNNQHAGSKQALTQLEDVVLDIPAKFNKFMKREELFYFRNCEKTVNI
jgi:hypothetical protein